MRARARPRGGTGRSPPGTSRSTQPLDRAVVEVQVGELGGAEVGLPADRLVALDARLAARAEHREAVVLGGDLDPARLQVLDRVVRAAVAERELERLEADRAAEQLVAEADAEDGPLADQLADRADDVVERAGVAGTVGEEDRVRVTGEDLVGASCRRAAASPGSPARGAARTIEQLDAGVDRRPREGRRRRASTGSVGRHRPGEVRARPSTARRRYDRARLGLDRLRREDPASHRPAVADVADERPRVDPADRRHAAVGEPVEPAALGRRQRPRRSLPRA